MLKRISKRTPLLTILLLSAVLSVYAQQQADPEGDFAFRIIDDGRAVEITGLLGAIRLCVSLNGYRTCR